MKTLVFLFFFTITLHRAYGQAGTDTLGEGLLDAVLIQSTRAGRDAPVPHVNIRAADIRQVYHAQDIPYLLSSTPSLVETSDAGLGIGYTGMRIRGTDPTRINVTINGVPLNDAESQAVFWVNMPDLAASAAEIQVQRGVGTSTNGAGAFGATVNIDMSGIEAEPGAEVSATVGSFHTQKVSARVHTGLLGDRFAFGGRLSSIRSDGYIDRAEADLQSFHLTGAYIDERQSVQAHILSGREMTYQAWYGVPVQYAADPSLRTFNVAGTERPGDPYDNEVDNYRQTHHLVHYKRQLTQKMHLQINGHYTRGKGFFEQYKAGQSFEDYGVAVSGEGTTDLIRRLWLDNHFYGSTFALQHDPDGPLEHTAGGAVSRYTGDHFGDVIWAADAANLPKDFRYYQNSAAKTDANIFWKATYKLAAHWAGLLDLQYRTVHYAFLGYDNNLNNVEQTASLHFFNPKIGATWTPSAAIQAYVFSGIGHREPNRDDYTQSTPNTRPRPERLYDLEGGLRWKRRTWNSAANLFYMHYRDQLVPDGRLNDVGAYIRTNVPVSHRAGLELECTGQPTPLLLLSGTLSLMQHRIRRFTEYRDNWDTGEQDIFVYEQVPIAFAPNVVARAEVGYTLLRRARQQLQTSLTGKHVGKQHLDNTGNQQTVLPRFTTIDWRVNYTLNRSDAGPKVDLVLTVFNLLQERYSNNGWTYRYTSQGFDETPINPYARAEGNGVYNQTGLFTQAGRHIMGSVRFVF